ncbi:B-cell scaffold protein with ankyrin repeats-like [Mobula hypostoma]|uniref:B-cell scaffold protein with ankyrin repeats-like n=1 Tax=Mobula hypostoma TaxID=723540 RepID=UPI002FC32293
MERSDVARRDMVILYGEDAGEWNVYLKDEFLQYLDPEGVCSFQIGLLEDLQTAAHTLADYRCKFLVLTSGLLKSLDNPQSQLLGNVLQPPATVVLLLCGVPSSDEFHNVLPVERRFKEVSAEQEPWEYVSMVISIVESDPIPVPKLKDLRPEMEVTEDLTDMLVNPDDFTEPLLVMPTQILCKNVTKIYLLLKHHLSLEERPEVEFVTGTQQLKVQASMLNSQTVCVRSVDLPAGPVILKLRCQGALLGSAQVIYFSQVEKVKRLLLKVTDPVQFICQAFQISTQTQLDDLLTKSLQNSLPSSRIGAFQSIGTDSHSPPHNEEDYECPTLLHFAAKNGLERLTTLLLDCPGAKQVSALLNSHGEKPGEVAKRYGFQRVHELMDRFMESTQRVEDQYEKGLEPSQGGEDEENIYEKMTGLLMAADKFEGVSKSEEVVSKEDPYILSMDKEEQYSTVSPSKDRFTTARPNKDRFTTARPNKDRFTTARPSKDRFTTARPSKDRFTTARPSKDRFTTAGPNKDRFTTAGPNKDRFTTAGPNKDRFTTARPNKDRFTTAVTKEDCYTIAVDEEDPYILVLGEEDRYTTAGPQKAHDTTAVDEEDPYDLVLDEEDRYTTRVPKEDQYTTAGPQKAHDTTAVNEEDPYDLELDEEDRYTTRVPKGDQYTTAGPQKAHDTTAVDEEDPYILVLGEEDRYAAVRPKEDRYTTARPKEHRHTVAFDDNDYTTVVPKKDRNTTAVDEEDPYILVLGDDDYNTTVRPKEDGHTARPEEHCHTVAFDDDRYTTVVPKGRRYPVEVDEEDPYTLTLDEDLCTTAVPKEGCYTMAEEGEGPGTSALDKEGQYDMVIPKEDYYTAVTKRDCYSRAVMKEDRYTRTVTREDRCTVDNPYDYTQPQQKSSPDTRKESRPPAPIPRPVVLSEAPSAPFIAQVFQQRTGREINEHIYGIMARDMKTQRDRENIYSLAAPMRQAPGPPKLPNLYDKLPNVR